MTAMMSRRQQALDGFAEHPSGFDPAPAAGFEVDLAAFRGPGGTVAAEEPELVGAVVDLLAATEAGPGRGFAVVKGLCAVGDLVAARQFHTTLFGAVWSVFRCRHGMTGKPFRLKDSVIQDGAISLDLCGSEWSFKDLHVDRDALLFSHLYGPVRGFGGGDLLLVDIRPYTAAGGFRFDDVFEWSDEPSEGAKPVLRQEHREPAFAANGTVSPGSAPTGSCS